jgi:hypothetical protein
VVGVKADAALGVFVVGLMLLTGVALSGCSPSTSEPSDVAPSVATKADVLREALRDPLNVTPEDWEQQTAADVERQALAVCDDLAAPMPASKVVEREMQRAPVSYFDADYFVRASAKVYCPRLQREAGYLS